MGGFGSGGHNRKHATVEACARIDAGMIRRAGYFSDTPPARPWAWRSTWRGGALAVTLGVYWVTPGHELAGLIVLPAGHRDGNADAPHAIACRVRVSYTDCNYGHRRAWLHCPKCGRRVYRLFYYPNLFDQNDRAVHTLQCRECGGFTYTQWAARGFDKAQARCMALADRMKARGGRDWGMWDTFPTKPKGMHHATYHRMWWKWYLSMGEAKSEMLETLSRMMKLD